MNVREIAFHSLVTICKDEGYSNIEVSKEIQKYKLADRDRRFYTELVYGTLRHLNYLDWIISHISTRKLNKLDPLCLAIVRMGLYQIFGMTKVPESAACNESVKLARKFGNNGMAKFVNAMLRNSIRRRREFVPPTLEEDAVTHISLTYHQQEWLVREWIKKYGQEDTIALCRYFDEIPDLCLRTNTGKISRDDLIKRLEEKGITAEKSQYSPEGIFLRNIPSISHLDVLDTGLAIIQDEPSQLVAHVLDPQPHEMIFDLCAAPGGKTTHIAALGGPTCVVYGGDIYNHKLKLIEDNARRLGLTNVRTILQNACTIGSSYANRADRVLVDAPCSGLGVLRHKIDLRWRKNLSDLRTLPALQHRLLENAAQCVKKGGVLVYSTCTMNDDENIRIVEAFLASHPEFHLERASDYCNIKQDGPCIQLLPQRDHMDGFFISRLRKGE
ncbi:MAG: 16S rRNA (cytosine(967)-C(5))-methyltransferase RsmB [Megasphaera sp.]|jgi:16S rRNA (cytosine967-C5)-methyltransferase|nr:16S rRNA (cytosine(967)-C(5))-methyltransferase RsmB [Megasphaera sp.]MCI1248682.1 16S rRNA (cytosine(967)-C(5))-methyltransferase RsmB [Megasphaera sp.]